MPPRLDLTVPHHPAVVDQINKRAEDAQLRVADQITRFAGSMQFVYLHIVDTVALIHALVLRLQAIVLPFKALVFGGH